MDKDFIEKELSKEDDNMWEVDGFTYDTEEEAKNAFRQECEINPSEDHTLMYGDEEIEYFEGNNTDSDFDEEIAESLRLAGVQLDEVNDEFHRKGQIVNNKTLFRNKEDDDQKYEEVSTSDFGKESSEGFKKPMCLEATVKMDKIKSIYETAKSMYAKKEPQDWLKLDRRYITKLMENGIGYSRASKMLMEAKKNK